MRGILKTLASSRAIVLPALCLSLAVTVVAAQNSKAPSVVPTSSSKVMGEIKFGGATKVERESGVWVDGNYVGYMKELKGDKKVLLLPGDHQIAVRQS
jgi:hypothetical protein